MLENIRTKKLLTVTGGILVFSLIGTQSWVSETLGYNLNVDLVNRNRPFVEVFSDKTTCSSLRTMNALLDDLSVISVQLTVHEERDGVIISDPIQGLIEELQLVYGHDLCTDFVDLSKDQQLLYIEIEKLVLQLKGLEIKAMHFEGDASRRISAVS